MTNGNWATLAYSLQPVGCLTSEKSGNSGWKCHSLSLSGCQPTPRYIKEVRKTHNTKEAQTFRLRHRVAEYALYTDCPLVATFYGKNGERRLHGKTIGSGRKLLTVAAWCRGEKSSDERQRSVARRQRRRRRTATMGVIPPQSRRRCRRNLS